MYRRLYNFHEPPLPEYMDKSEMIEILRRYRGASAWICRALNYDKANFSHWLHGRKVNHKLQSAVDPLVKRLERTKGSCMFVDDDVDGKNVRSQLPKLRRKKTSPKKRGKK